MIRVRYSKAAASAKTPPPVQRAKPGPKKPKTSDADRIAPYRWKKGQSGNPLGRPPGTGSIVKWLRDRLQGPAFRRPDRYLCLAQELADIILRQANRGNYKFLELLLDKAEHRRITEEEMQAEVERVFDVVCSHVQDPEVRAAIARDLLIKEKEQTDGD